MKSLSLCIGVLCVSMLLASRVPAGEDKELRAIIAKGIAAQGGAENTAKFESATMRAEGKFYGLGEGLPYTGVFSHAGLDRMRIEMDFKAMGQDIKVMVVVNKDKGWMKINDMLMEMAADEVAEERAQMHADWVASLVPLSDKSYSLSALGEVKVEGKPAVGVRVSMKGQRDINLYLDKQSGLVVKYEHMIKDVKAGGKEMNQECFFGDYKEFAGAKMPTRFVIKRDGNLFMEGVCSDIRPEQKLDPSVFEKP